MDDYNSYLAHHGIQGQKWGIRRYQNRDGSLTAEGRRRLGYGEPRKSLKQKIAEKRQAYKDKDKHTKTPEEERAELKEYLRKHPKKLPKYNHELTQEEANEIISNINFDRKLKDIRNQEYTRALGPIISASSGLFSVANLINAGKTVYNNYAEINNVLVATGIISGNFMPKLGERPEDMMKKAHEEALDTYLRNHTATDFYNNRSNWAAEDAKKAQQYYNNLDNLSGKNKGSKGNYDSQIQDILDRLNDLENK